MKQKGMTLTSVLVAVALTSALAVVASKLVSNQAKLNKIMTLTDQRDMITRFYSALMHNRLVWRCTLYDTNNSALLAYITNTAASFSGTVELHTPDCKFKENSITEGIEELRTLTSAHGSGDHYRSSGAFFDTHNPVLLGESLTEHDANGWWRVRLTANPIAKGSIDLVLTVEFDEDNYKARHANFDPPDIRDTTEYKVRLGEPNVQGSQKDCSDKAIVAIDDLASGLRSITCSIDDLVDVPDVGTQARGHFLHSLPDGKRVGDASHLLVGSPAPDVMITRAAMATDTTDRTGLRRAIPEQYAITQIYADGSYELAPVDGDPGVLGFKPALPGSQGVCLHNSPALSEIIGGVGKWTNHQGPRGKQGLPGPHGHWGDPGDPGPPAPPCPATPPPCPP